MRASSPWPSRPSAQEEVSLDLGMFTMYNQTLMGSVFGSQTPRMQIPRLLELYRHGQLLVDELVTKEYTLDQVQQGYDDVASGKNVRGVRQVRLIAEAERHRGPQAGSQRAQASRPDRTRHDPGPVGEVIGEAERREGDARRTGGPHATSAPRSPRRSAWRPAGAAAGARSPPTTSSGP